MPEICVMLLKLQRARWRRGCGQTGYDPSLYYNRRLYAKRGARGSNTCV